MCHFLRFIFAFVRASYGENFKPGGLTKILRVGGNLAEVIVLAQ